MKKEGIILSNNSGTKFNNVITNFTQNIAALDESFPLIMMWSWAMRGKTQEEKNKFLNKFGKLIGETDEGKEYTIPLTHTGKLRLLDRKSTRAKLAYKRLPNIFLVSLVSEYDAFMGNLIRAILEVKPQILNTSEKNISYKDLEELNSIESAREQIIEREIESVLRKSHSDQFKWLEKTLDVTLTKDLKCWSSFIEITERRNLFVHCEGVVSSQYMAVCSLHGAKEVNDVKIGDSLSVSREYLKKSFQCLFEIAVKLSQVIWRKLVPSKISEADLNLNEIGYYLIQENNYNLAVQVYEFAVFTLKKWGSDANRRIFVINLAQSHYHLNNKKECMTILEKEDWSSCSDEYKICVAALADDKKEFFNIMSKIGSTGAVREREYIDWPVFCEMRKLDEFEKLYEKIFGKKPADFLSQDGATENPYEMENEEG